MKSELQENLAISVAEMLEKAPSKMKLEVISGSLNLDNNYINSARMQKLGLAFAGYNQYIHDGRIQIIGQSEISYLSQMKKEEMLNALEYLDLTKSRCVLITTNIDLPFELFEKLKKNNIPIIKTPLVSSQAISCLSSFLQNYLAPKITIHGVMLGIFGLGILILGESGIGKSECALDLVRMGHRLISDDSVTIKKIGDVLEASSPELTFEYIEIRGLGILNVRDLFGVSAIGKSANIDFCIELKKWKDVNEIDRLGIEMKEEVIFDLRIPKFILPVSSGRNISTLVETSVRVFLLKTGGHNSAEQLIEKHKLSLCESTK